MNTHRPKIQFFPERCFQEVVFSVLSALGLLLGILLSTCNSHLAAAIDINAFCATPKFISILIVNAIPIITLACIMVFSLKVCYYPFVFLDALCRGFVGMFFCIPFGAGAWLARFLICFSSYITAILMWWLLFRGINRPRTSLLKDTCLSLIVIFGVTVVDYLCITPLLSNIIV